MDLDPDPEFNSWLLHLPSIRPWAICIPSLSPSFLICEMGINQLHLHDGVDIAVNE